MKNRRDEMRQIWCGNDGPPGSNQPPFDAKPFAGGGHPFDSSSSPFAGFGAEHPLGLASSHHQHLQQQHRQQQQQQLHHLQQQQQQQQHQQLMTAASSSAQSSPSFSLTPLHIGRREDDGIDDEDDEDIVEDSRDSESPISDIEIAT